MGRQAAGPVCRLVVAMLLAVVVAWPVAGFAKEDDGFAAWLDGVRLDALAEGISAPTVAAALAGIEPLPVVIKADRHQPEFKTSLEDYLAARVTPARIRQGRALLRKHRRLLDRIARRYPVLPRYLVALWGIESDFGRHQGNIPVIQALATLAYDGRRSEYFRGELLDALRILDAGHITLDKLRGSWAGAMGQLQFMPSTFLHYAVDQSGDGRIDIFTDEADVLASAANYLAKSGWQRGRLWGREVRLPKAFDRSLLGMEQRFSLKRWRQLGVRKADGGRLLRSEMEASLIQPEGKEGRAFLVYQNYRVLRTWNRSHSFALAVGLLADKLGRR